MRFLRALLTIVATLAVGLSASSSAMAQASQTRAQLESYVSTNIGPNGVGAVTGTIMQRALLNQAASTFTLLDTIPEGVWGCAGPSACIPSSLTMIPANVSANFGFNMLSADNPTFSLGVNIVNPSVPFLYMDDSAVTIPTDAHAWTNTISDTDGSFHFKTINDAGTSEQDWLIVTRTGLNATLADFTIPLSVPAITAPSFNVVGPSNPFFYMDNSSLNGGANLGAWDMTVLNTTGTLQFNALGDTSGSNAWMSVTRSGFVPQLVTIAPAVTIGGTLNAANAAFPTTNDAVTFSFLPPTFGGTWLTQSEFTSSYQSTHTDGRATMNISRTALGSGQNGPGTADYGAFITSQKTNYLTSTVEGEVDGLFCLAAQGNHGDSACMLGAASKVFGGSSPTGGVLGNQLEAIWINSSGQALMNINTIEAFGEGAGGQSNNTGYGYWTENTGAVNAVAASQITPFSAYYADALDQNGNCPTHCPTWTNGYTLAGSASAGDIFFNVAWGINQSGKITLGSGNATGKDGNPTLSTGIRLSLEDNGGTAVWRDSGGGITAQLTQVAQWVLGAAGKTPAVEFVGGTSGTLTIQPATATLVTNLTATLPTNTGTIAETNFAQTWSAIQTYSSPVNLVPISIATLLAITCNSASEGEVAFVKDTTGSAAATFHLTVAGSGATTVNSLASCNGSNWQYD